MNIELIDFGYKNKPKRAHHNDAGADVYSLKTYYLRSFETIKIPLGFGLKIPDGYCAFIVPRSRLSSEGIVCELAPIDSGYRGQIYAIVTNNSNYCYKISENQRIGQIIVLPIIICDFVSRIDTPRDGRSFGSTGV